MNALRCEDLIAHFGERFANDNPYEYDGIRLDSVRVIELLSMKLKRGGCWDDANVPSLPPPVRSRTCYGG